MMSPGLPQISLTVPAHGDGTSTSALSVCISASVWLSLTVSPAFTFQLMSSASARPSPRSGRRKWLLSLGCLIPAMVVPSAVGQYAITSSIARPMRAASGM